MQPVFEHVRYVPPAQQRIDGVLGVLGWGLLGLGVVAMLSTGGKGFGGGEATRDPAPTIIDPNDPKGKQQAIHEAVSFAEYMAKRQGATAAPAAAAPAVSTPPAVTTAPAATTTGGPLGTYADYLAKLEEKSAGVGGEERVSSSDPEPNGNGAVVYKE